MKSSHLEKTDLSKLKAKVQNMNKPQWLISDQKIDHGPFTGPEVLEKIESGYFLSGCTIQNLITKEKPLSFQKHPVWGPLIGKVLRVKNQEHEKRSRLHQQKRKAQKRFLQAFFLITAITGTVMAVQHFPKDTLEEMFTNSRAPSKTKETEESVNLNNPSEVSPPAPSIKRKNKNSISSKSKTLHTHSFEKGLETAVQFTNIQSNEKEKILSSAQVKKTLDRRLRKFQRCFLQLPSHGKGLGQIPIDMAIGGNGKVLGVSTRKGNAAFKACVDSIISRIKFPSFSSPRMTAHYSLYSQ